MSRSNSPRRARRGKKAPGPLVRWRRLFLEPLEERVLLTATWKNPAGGDWGVPSNWTSGTVPGANDDVVIDVPSALVTITHSSGTDTVKSLVSNENLTLSGGSLTVTTTVQVAGSFTLSGGTLAGATVVTGTTLKGTTSGGTLGNVTLQGTLDLTTAGNVSVSVTGPLTLDNGSVALGNSSGGYGFLQFDDAAASITGTGSVVFSNQSNSVYNTLQENASGGTLTIGPGVTVRGGSGSVGYNAFWGDFANVRVVNHGTIAADGPGALTVNGVSVTNSGTLLASNGATLTVPPRRRQLLRRYTHRRHLAGPRQQHLAGDRAVIRRQQRRLDPARRRRRQLLPRQRHDERPERPGRQHCRRQSRRAERRHADYRGRLQQRGSADRRQWRGLPPDRRPHADRREYQPPERHPRPRPSARRQRSDLRRRPAVRRRPQQPQPERRVAGDGGSLGPA